MKRFLWVAGLMFLCIFIILITVYRGVFYFFGGEPTLHMPSERKIEKLLSENYELYSNAANILLTIDEDFLIRDTYDTEEIETALKDKYYSVSVRNRALPARDIWEGCGDDTLTGLFLERMRVKYDSAENDEERETIVLAVRSALAALEMREGDAV